MEPVVEQQLTDTVIENIKRLFMQRGDRICAGEAVTQLQHALQAATLAMHAGSHQAMVCAALLHDVGHLLDPVSSGDRNRVGDDLHQYRVVPLLRKLVGRSVIEPIRLHVDAKRYLCAVDFEYFLRLSADSKRSLELQGGIFTPAQIGTFETQRYFKEALQLRRWDDLAKEPDMNTPNLDYFLNMLHEFAMSQCSAVLTCEE